VRCGRPNFLCKNLMNFFLKIMVFTVSTVNGERVEAVRGQFFCDFVQTSFMDGSKFKTFEKYSKIIGNFSRLFRVLTFQETLIPNTVDIASFGHIGPDKFCPN